MRSVRWCLLLGVISGCGGVGSSSLDDTPDATPVDAPAPRTALTSIRAAVSHAPTLATRLEGMKGKLALEGETLRSYPLESPKNPALYAHGPAFADAAITVGVGGANSWTSRWSLVGAAHVTATLEDGHAIYGDAYPSTDVVVAADDHSLETFYVLRKADAPREMRMRIARSAAVVGYQREPSGAIALVDAEHLAVVRVSAPFAVDALGKKVDVPMTLEGDEIVLRLDATGLTYPIVVDPVLSTAVWTHRVDTTTGLDTFQVGGGGIYYTAFGFSASLGRVIAAGGQSGSSGTGVDIWMDWDSLHGRWIKGPGTFAPPATLRSSISMAADSNTNQIAFFGHSTGYVPLGDAFFHDGSNWYPFCNEAGTCSSGDCSKFVGKCLTGTTATKRRGAAAGYVGGQYMVFGGYDSLGNLANDTCKGSTFPLSCSTLTGPSGRWAPSFAVDSDRGKLVMFGGYTSAPVSETWEWSPAGGWVARCGTTPATPCGIPASSNVPMAYDAVRKVMVQPIRGPFNFQTWEFDGVAGTWTKTCDDNTGLPVSCGINQDVYGYGFSWDPVLQRGVLAGGQQGVSPFAQYSWTWEYHVRGNACATGCDTGFCVDGVCCEQSTCGTCQACNLAGNVGKCAAVTNADDPDTCPSTTSTCNGAGACTSKLGIACTAGANCASGNCVASSVGSVCCASSSCASGQICKVGTGQCIGDLGYACTSGTECQSGFCVDGVCCDTACDPSKPCQACNNAGNVGHCSTTLGAPTSTRGTCAKSSSTDTACNQSVCDGSDATKCHYPGGSTTCASGSTCSATSSSATESDPAGCDGAGACRFTTKSCGVFGCSGSTCRTSCSVDTDCIAGYFCSAGTCVVRVGQGAPCTSSSQCASAYTCVNGVCCGSSSCPNGTCNGSHPGTCTLNQGQSCSAASQCTSSNCVDGVCCDQACSGQCQACNVAGKVGSCSTITGTPVSPRPACSAVSSDPTCGPTTCNGSNPAACSAPTGGTTCGAASCTSGTAKFAGKCDGSGVCLVPPSIACAPYVCGPTACKTSCTTGADCIGGYYCSSAGTCLPQIATGLACSSGAQCVSGNCVDGVCCSSASCGAGASCNLPGYLGTCKVPQGGTCSAGSQCVTGFCADGVCCNTACTGQCEACDGGGGICNPVTGAPHGTRTACVSGTGDPVCSVSSCNGSLRTACAYPSGTSCGGGCAAGSATTKGSCDGAGACAGSSKIACAPYVCGATACKTTCSSGADCAAGNYCDSTGHCAALLATGTTCTSGSQCSSGNCVDGVCCGSASCAGGGVCNDPSHLGACVIPNGKACVSGTPCSSGNCVDGYCCNSSCTGQCEACDVAGLLGVCSPVPAAQQPHGTRAACVNSGTDPTCSVAACDGSTRAVCRLPSSAVSCGENSCVGGTFTSKGTCSGGGACVPNINSGCSPYVCGTSSCLTSCSDDTQCASGYFCDATSHLCQALAALGKPCTTASACGSKLFCNLTDSICCEASTCPNGTCNGSNPGHCTLNNGQACTKGSDCTSGNCVDGVCCNTSCKGNCESCNVDTAHAGVCTPVVGAPLGGRPLCASDGTSCGTKVCNGVDTAKCNYPTSSTACGAQTCTTGTETAPGSCDGAGGCSSTTRACGTFLCGDKTCKAKCTSDADCVSTAFCDASGSCQLRGAAGRPCDPAAPTSCGDGLGCQDGVCCADPKCSADNGFCAGDHPGVCLLVNDSTCTKNADCHSGHCVEIDATSGKGICCDTACEGTCESCSDPSAPGTCIPVRGAPAKGHGTCPAGTGDACSGSVCDGKARSSCEGKPGKETICQAASCVSGKSNPDISCDGSGKCPTVTPAFCDNFRVCSTPTLCAQGPCTADADCVEGYACDAPTGKCRPKAAHCKDGDPTTAVDAVGNEQSCIPYLCDASGSCKTTCGKSEDCAGGFLCDSASRQCVPPSMNDVGDGGGCGCATPGTSSSSGWAIGAALALVVGLARRRRSL